jgi:hypothetical protein
MLCRIVRKLPLAAAFLALLSALPASAQDANTQLYAVKFFCGFTDGRIPKLNDPTPLPAPYRAVEPGNYATVINITNLSLANTSANLSRSVRVEGLAQVSLGTVTLQPFQVNTVNCDDIAQILAAQRGFQGDGRFVEGYVVISTRLVNPVIMSLDVQGAYSYAVQKVDNNGTGLGSSLQVVRIEPRLMFQPE